MKEFNLDDFVLHTPNNRQPQINKGLSCIDTIPWGEGVVLEKLLKNIFKTFSGIRIL